MNNIRYTLIAMFLLCMSVAQGRDLCLVTGQGKTFYIPENEPEVVRTAAQLFADDYKKVFDADLSLEHRNFRNADFIAGLVSDKVIAKLARKHGIDVMQLASAHEAFTLKVIQEDGAARLLAIGSDKRGLAYAMMHLSRELGVSPWYWWADVAVQPKDSLVFAEDYEVAEQPDVAYRGIFINDEDWGMMPWASNTFEPTGVKGEIGPKTHEKIFELMLRLRANVFWPAMHDCSRPFFLNPRNQLMADKYGIMVSTSHCEPMMCNANGEWRDWANDPKGVRYNYVSNPDSVLLFWKQRVRQLKNSDCIYTLGMRGIHDGPMQGAKTIAEQTGALRGILKDQRNLLQKEIGKDLKQIPQQFIPYKEVLDCYHNGLEIPEDVTLIWCDDNYGYVRHQPTEEERSRPGGNGLYYHISYWGRPHDYLWLSTIHPELLQSEMLRAYDHGIDRMWILNAGDIKPAEFEIQLYMDLAWDTDRLRTEESLWSYCDEWYSNALGVEYHWSEIWRMYYDLAFSFKPEWMGGTRTEEKDPRWKQPADLPLNEVEVRKRLSEIKKLSYLSELPFSANCRLNSMDAAVFELFTYPIRCMAAQNEKWLSAQLARHGLGPWSEVQSSHEAIVSLTDNYNTLLDGKWKGMMDMAPRQLADFSMPMTELSEQPMPIGQKGILVYCSPSVVGQSVLMGDTLTCDVYSSASQVNVEIHLLPVHPSNDREIRFAVFADGQQPQIIDYHTEGRSEEWKNNVLYNKAVRRISLSVDSNRVQHELSIVPLDEDIKVQKVYLQ